MIKHKYSGIALALLSTPPNHSTRLSSILTRAKKGHTPHRVSPMNSGQILQFLEESKDELQQARCLMAECEEIVQQDTASTSTQGLAVAKLKKDVLNVLGKEYGYNGTPHHTGGRSFGNFEDAEEEEEEIDFSKYYKKKESVANSYPASTYVEPEETFDEYENMSDQEASFYNTWDDDVTFNTLERKMQNSSFSAQQPSTQPSTFSLLFILTI